MDDRNLGKVFSYKCVTEEKKRHILPTLLTGTVYNGGQKPYYVIWWGQNTEGWSRFIYKNCVSGTAGQSVWQLTKKNTIPCARA